MKTGSQDAVEDGVIDEDESDQALLEKSERMYREYILDHYANPRNHGILEHADAEVQVENPVCGDQFTITIHTENGVVDDVMFDGRGCAISTAAASILTAHITGTPVEDVEQLEADDVLELLGIDVTQSRLKCATLALHGIHKTLNSTDTAEE